MIPADDLDYFVDRDDDLPRHRSGLRQEMRYGGEHRRRRARQELERQCSDRPPKQPKVR